LSSVVKRGETIYREVMTLETMYKDAFTSIAKVVDIGRCQTISWLGVEINNSEKLLWWRSHEELSGCNWGAVDSIVYFGASVQPNGLSCGGGFIIVGGGAAADAGPTLGTGLRA
jgi:hypothetical protein